MFIGVNCEKKEIVLELFLDENGEVLVVECYIVYDKLIFVIGSKLNDFGIKGVVEYCIFLDSFE